MNVFPLFACDGGPHLLLPVSLGPAWRGTAATEDVLDPSSDYGRACAAAEPISIIPVADGQAVVLGGSPPMSSWAFASDPSHFVVFVLHDWNTDDPDLLLAAAHVDLPAAPLTDTTLQWHVPFEGAALLFAGDRLTDPVYEPLHLPIAAGHYHISAADYDSHLGALTAYLFFHAGT